MKYLKRITAVLGFLAIATLSQSVLASTSVNWTNPANGSNILVGTSVAPTGNASAIGSTSNGLDLALVLDSSGSMKFLSNRQVFNGSLQTLQSIQKQLAVNLVNNLPTTNVAVTIVEFDSDANVVRSLSPLLTDKAAIIAAINTVDAIGGTRIDLGINTAKAELTGGNHTTGWSQQMVVFSDGQNSTGSSPVINAATAAHAAGVTVHTVAMGRSFPSTMSQTAAAGGGTFIDARSAAGLQTLNDLFSGAGGSLVGVDHVDITMPDGTPLGSVAVDAFGNFQTPNWLMALGPNTFVATAYGTDGTSASATLTLNGIQSGNVPEPSIIGLFGLGLLGMVGIRRRRKA